MLPFAEAGHPDLALLSFLRENEKCIEHWDKLLGTRRTVGVFATDAHRNSLPPLLATVNGPTVTGA